MNNPPNIEDINNELIQMIKMCIPFFKADNIELRKKSYNLNLLYAMWNKDTNQDYSPEVYAAMAEMFASNVFRPLPPSSYAICADDESTVGGGGGVGVGAAADVASAAAAVVSREPANEDGAANTAAEYMQTANAYQVFQAFVERASFDPVKAGPHLSRRRFVNCLVHRFNSADDYERLIVRGALARVWRTCPSARAHALNATVAELADFAYGYVPWHNGVEDLLDFLAETVASDGHVDPSVIDKSSRVLVHLLKHQSLFSFKTKIIECAKVLDCYQKDLIPRMLKFIMKLWSCQNLKTIPLLRTMIELYEWCDKEQWAPLQTRIVSHLSMMFSNVDFQLADEAMNFWNHILHDNIKFWQNNQDDVRIVVNALAKVKETHWNADCIKMANSLLNIMAVKNVIKDNSMEDPEEVFQEGKSRMINCDSISKGILDPLKQYLKLTDASNKTESTIV